MFMSTIRGSFIPLVVAMFIGSSRLRAVIKRLPCHFIVEELQRLFQCTFSGKSDLPPNLPHYDTGLVAMILLCDRLTTEAALQKVRQYLGIPAHIWISAGGLKDRWAWTAQLIVLPWKDMEKLKKLLAAQGGYEYSMKTRQFYLKDAHSARQHLDRGHLEGNRFTIIAEVEGASKELLEQYLDAAIVKAKSMKASPILAGVARAMNLGDNDILVPNAYGNQREGARQTLSQTGEDLILYGPEVAFKRFLLEITSNEGHRARDLRKALAKEWVSAEAAIADQQRKAAESGDPVEIDRTSKLTVVNMRMHLQGMLEILEAPDRFAGYRPAYEVANMVYEWKLVRSMFLHLDWEAVLRDQKTRRDISLWIGAYQGYHFNQLLAKITSGEFQLETLITRLGQLVDAHITDDQRLQTSYHKRNLRLMEVPLFSLDKVAMAFYQEFMPEAIPAQLHPLVAELFLKPGGNGKGPWRPPYVVPKGLEWECEEGRVKFRFTLRSGAYATTFLGLIFNLVEAKKDKNKQKKRFGNRR